MTSGVQRSDPPKQPDVPAGAPPSDETFGVFAMLASVVMALVFVAYRSGFGGDTHAVAARSVGIAWLFTALPALVGGVQRRRGEPLAWSGLTVFAVLFVVLAAGSIPTEATSATIGLALSAVGLLSGTALFYRWATSSRAGRAVHVAFAVGLGAWGAAYVWGAGVANPLFEESIAGGQAHIDTLYHATTSSMIRTYGIPTTGLDGLPYVPYHWGSHFLFAAMSSLLRCTPAMVYAGPYAIVFVPLLAQAILVLASVARGETGDAWGRPGHLRVYAVLLLGFVGVLPATAMRSVWCLSDSLVSESFTVGTTFALLGAAVLVSALRAPDPTWSPGRRALVLLFSPTLVAVLAFSKVSIALQLLAAATFLIVRRRELRRWEVVGGLALSYGVALVLRKTLTPVGQIGGFFPFNYVLSFVAREAIPLFFVVSFFWGWVLLAFEARRLGAARVDALLAALWRGESPALDATVVMAGFAVPMIALLAAGSAPAFFMWLPMWFALAFVLGALRPPTDARTDGVIARLRGMAPSQAAVAAGIALVGVNVAWTALLQVATCLRENVGTRLAIAHAAGDEEVSLGADFRSALSHARVARRELARSSGAAMMASRAPSFEMLRLLRELGARPREERRRTALFIPQSAQAYWGLHQLRLSSEPFVAPMIAQTAMVDGVPVSDKGKSGGKTIAYGYPVYKLRTEPQPPLPEYLDEIRLRARAKGFSRLVVVDTSEDGSPRSFELPL